MEFRFEAILETILVGSVASLFLLSLLFLFFGHVFRVDPIRRIAQFALYEEKFVKEEDRAPTKSDDKHLSFAFLLLIALLYGLGATVESITHDINVADDKGIKAEAFAKVGRGQVEGKTVPQSFARFVTDDIACRAINIAADAKVDNSPCQEIFRQEREFYYAAKNAVFQKESFARELAGLQSRIDFVRSACISLGMLCLATLLATLIATVFERLVNSERKTPHGRLHKGADKPSLAQHWKELAAVRCFLITLLLGAFTGVSFVAWRKVETQYDRRIFGYFLSLEGGSVPELPTEGHEGGSSESVDKEHGGSEVVLSPLPVSPYRVFSTAWPIPFEPSAIQSLGDPSRFVVANDRGGAFPFLLFDFDATGFHHPRILEESDKSGKRFVAPEKPGRKFEALHYTPKGKGGRPRILAIATTAQKPDADLVAFDFSVDFDSARATDIDEKTVENPCRSLSAANPGATACSIEGVALRDKKTSGAGESEQGAYLLLGVRYLLGPDPKQHKPVVAVVVLEKAGDSWKNPQLILKRGRVSADPCPDLSGVSDIQILDEDNLLVLTSVELWNNEQCTRGVAHPIPVAQVQGALWLAHQNGNGQASDPRLLQTFAHKPEGLTLLNEGSALVVFDDDADRKSIRRAPDTFALEQNQSVFTIVRLDK